jgi:hypothetical protein
VLQIEELKEVRLIAYVSTPDLLYDPATLREAWLTSDGFYDILQNWRDRFD